MSSAHGTSPAWAFQYKLEPDGHVHKTPLYLQYALPAERGIADEYPIGGDPREPWGEWLDMLVAADHWSPRGRPWLSIGWGIVGDGTGEHAPPVGDYRGSSPNFLDYFTVPTNAETGDPIDWTQLPIVDQEWRGTDPFLGFVARASRWRPRPFQTEVSLDEIKRLAA